MDSKSPILKARNIYKSFSYPTRVEILKGISIDIFKGQSTAIMGASGEGKSTLLQILGTLEGPTSGELIIAGKKIEKRTAFSLRNAHIGFVFQSFHLLENYTVLQNVLMPALIGKKEIKKGSTSYKRAETLLESVGLQARGEFATNLLSGGEKQRVAIARALMNDPEIIMADEPTGNLDHENSRRVYELLLHLSKNLNKALVVVTHDRELASVCDRVLVLREGRLFVKNP